MQSVVFLQLEDARTVLGIYLAEVIHSHCLDPMLVKTLRLTGFSMRHENEDDTVMAP